MFTLVLLFGSVFPVSAADETASQTLDILGMSPSMYAVSADENTHSDYTSTMVTSLYTFENGTENVLFKNTNNEYYAADRYKTVVLSNYITINPDTQYSVSFMHSLNNGSAYEIRVYCMVYSGSNITKIPIYSENFIGTYRVGNISDFSFKIPSSAVGTSYKCRLYIEHIIHKEGYYTGWTPFIQRYITVENDDVSWLVKILNAIKAIPSNISGFFTSLGDRIGTFFGNLGDRISGFFSDLKTNIGNWFDAQLQKIQDFYNGVKQWFKELGDRIQGFFVDLYNDIIEGLKRLFIPADGYFESKKTELETFCIEHFGALYQAPDVMLDFVVKLTTISPKVPSITMPAIQFDFQGVRYVLCDSITYSFAWVNDSSNALFYFYKFYRGFVTLLLFLFFGNFCIKKYNEVFAGGDPD